MLKNFFHLASRCFKKLRFSLKNTLLFHIFASIMTKNTSTMKHHTTSYTRRPKALIFIAILVLLMGGNAMAQGYDLNECTVSNVPEESYLYTGSVISLPTPVVTYGNVTLVEGTHYTATITKSNGDVVTEVRYTGDYTLTLAAISPCTGTRQFPFSVVMPWYGQGNNWFAPYRIHSVEEFEALAYWVSRGHTFEGRYFRLDADLAYDPETPNNHMPIGNEQHPFKGAFEGRNFTISGIRISGDGDYQALFGNIVGDTVKNLNLTDAEIAGGTRVAGLVANNNGGKVRNCHVSNATISGSGDYVGGIVGWNKNDTLMDCTVSNATFAAGSGAIIGSNNYSRYRHHNYYFDCTVGGATVNVGTGSGDTGGARLALPVNLPATLVFNESSVDGIIRDDQLYGGASEHLMLNEPDGLIYQYPCDNGTVAPSGPSTYKLMIAADATTAVNVSTAIDIWDVANGADGSEAHPYLITTIEDMEYLAFCVNIGGHHLADTWLALGNDLAYDPDNLTLDHDGDGTNESNYTAIGGNTSFTIVDQYFSGHFDGCGNTISGIRLYSSNSYQGIFGYIIGSETSSAEVKNLILDNAEITGRSEVGGIVGSNNKYRYSGSYINGGTVINCHVTNSVTIHAFPLSTNTEFGGIVGKNSGTVSYCTSSATFIMNAESLINVGGVVGANSGRGTNIVSHCTSTATFIFGTTPNLEQIGGVVGINASSDSGSGIVHNCLAIGITIPSNEGEQYGIAAVVGSNRITGTLDHNYYYDCNILGENSNIGYGIYYFDYDLDDYIIYLGDQPENDGAMPGHLLSLGNHITSDALSLTVPACGETPETTYHVAPSGATVTLGFEYPDSAITYYVNGEAIEGNTFTMPAEDVTVMAVWTDYTIHSADDWELFCDALQDNDIYNRFIGETVLLAEDITVTRMAGSSYHDFMGTFDGQGHTLTVAYSTADEPLTEEYAAPFRNVENGCVIENLHVAGTITTANKYAAGIVAQQFGAVTIRNCRSSVTIQSSIEGDGTHGGLVGVKGNSNNANLTIEGCTFDGKIVSTGTTATTNCGGFVGWRSNSGSLTITNSLYAPTADDNAVASGATFARNWTMPDDANCYYTETLGTAQGKLAIVNPAVSPTGEATATYDVSELAFYSNGVQFGEVFYCDSELLATQTIALASGANWVSFDVEITLNNLKTVLVDAVPGTSITVKGQNRSTRYLPAQNKWVGNLNTLDLTQMYIITVSADTEITLVVRVNSAALPITIKNGTNWMAFPLSESLTLTDAFTGFAVNGDVVKGQNSSARFVGNRWVGKLTTLEPGKGYLYNSAASEDRTFTF